MWNTQNPVYSADNYYLILLWWHLGKPDIFHRLTNKTWYVKIFIGAFTDNMCMALKFIWSFCVEFGVDKE